MVISASLQACGVVFPFATLTSICRSIVTICSGLYLLIGMTSYSSKWILSHSTWYKFCRSRQERPLSLPRSAFLRTQLISYRLPKADSALLRSSLFHPLCCFVSSSSGGLASAREPLCRGLGSG